MTTPADQRRVPRGKRAAAWLAAAGAVGGLITASPDLTAFLHQWEDGGKQIRTVYADKLAQGLPTACNGLTNHTSRKPVVVGETWTEEECAAEFGHVLQADQRQIIECFEQRPPQSVFDAASTLSHNVGAGMACRSQAMQAWGRGEWNRGCELLAYTPDGKPNWSSRKTGRKLADGRPEMVFQQGLHNRRVAEMRLCKRDL
jgi:GH24 family phage-related lysozyme (muramidase)